VGGWAWGATQEEADAEAWKIVEAVKAGLGAFGLKIHKEQVGPRLVQCGIENGMMEDGEILSGPERVGLRTTKEATHAALMMDLRDGGISPKVIEGLMGHWTYRTLSRRAGLSVWDQVYLWLRKNRKKKKARLWPGVRAELLTAASLCSLYYANLGLPWSRTVPALDASGESLRGGLGGFGVVGTTATLGEVREAGKWAEQKGWFYQVHPQEESGGDPGGPELPEVDDTKGEMDRVLEALDEERRVVYLGPSKSHWVAEWKRGGETNIIEWSLRPSSGGLPDEVVERFVEDAKDPRTWAVCIDLPWSGFAPGGRRGPRSRRDPEGFLSQSVKEKERLREEKRKMMKLVEVTRHCLEAGTQIYWLHPEDSLAWQIQEIRETLDQWQPELKKALVVGWKPRGGGLSKTRVLTSAEWFGSEVAKTRLGRGSPGDEGPWVRLVQCALDRKPGLGVVVPDVGDRKELPLSLQSKKKEGPPLAAAWGDPGRYRLWVRGKWRHKEHCNVLEGRTGVMALRHMARSSENWGRRTLFLTDSKASLGAFCKGRSSARSYISLCRRAASLSFATDIICYWRYLETWRNPADGPSRGKRYPGVYGTPPPHGYST
jgi:hypothetical protein